MLDETFLVPETEPADELHEEKLLEAQEDAAEDEANPSEPDEKEEGFEEVVTAQ